MASAATNPAGNFSAAGNGAARQTVTCAGGSQAILEEDLVRWLPLLSPASVASDDPQVAVKPFRKVLALRTRPLSSRSSV